MKKISLARGLAAVSPSRIREIADVAFGMDEVLKLHFGESNRPTPEFIKKAAVRALDEGYTYYTENAGNSTRCGSTPEPKSSSRLPGFRP